jgi:hypothetical protein
MDHRPKNSFSMSYASRKVIFPGGDDKVAVPHTHLHCGILVRDYRDCALPIPPWVHDSIVGQGLLVEKHSVDR